MAAGWVEEEGGVVVVGKVGRLAWVEVVVVGIGR